MVKIKLMTDLIQNTPDLWRAHMPKPAKGAHKYTRGHAVICGAQELTGATRLAAEACARIGAGLVTVLCTKKTAAIYRSSLPAHILVRDNLKWRDERVTAQLYGPGGLPCKLPSSFEIPTVLDAEALYHLPKKLGPGTVLTPHEGEFTKPFPELKGSREERAREVAEKTGAIIVLKGAETVIAGAGQVVVNTHAGPYLATAGTGDVLAGMITGLLAQEMQPFLASCAAVWMHGECALRFGPGLVAGDLPSLIPDVLKDFT